MRCENGPLRVYFGKLFTFRMNDLRTHEHNSTVAHLLKLCATAQSVQVAVQFKSGQAQQNKDTNTNRLHNTNHIQTCLQINSTTLQSCCNDRLGIDCTAFAASFFDIRRHQTDAPETAPSDATLSSGTLPAVVVDQLCRWRRP